MVSKADLKPFSQSGQPSINLVGSWQNELGSTMTVTTQNADGSFSGSYTSLVSAGGGTVTGTLLGYVNADAIAWTVNWPSNLASITAWAGQVLISGSTPFFYTLWHLTESVADESNWWDSINSGADLFFSTTS